jgi:hypothetical protein
MWGLTPKLFSLCDFFNMRLRCYKWASLLLSFFLSFLFFFFFFFRVLTRMVLEYVKFSLKGPLQIKVRLGTKEKILIYFQYSFFKKPIFKKEIKKKKKNRFELF